MFNFGLFIKQIELKRDLTSQDQTAWFEFGYFITPNENLTC